MVQILNYKIYTFLLLFFTSLNLNAQTPAEIQQALEVFLENAESNADYTQIADELSAYLSKALNLNTASQDMLFNFPLITQIQAIDIINHRNKNGYFISFAELQVLGFTPEQIRSLKPFISIEINTQQQLRNLLKAAKNGHWEMMSTQKLKIPVDENTQYLGNALNQSMRIRYTNAGIFSAGITAEKDAGEAYWNKGPDFYSAHLFIQNTGKIKSAVIGDYVLGMGQGLVMGSGIGMGKSALVLNISRGQNNIKPYRGVNEYFFLRGAAISFNVKKWNITLAAAKNRSDARLKQDSNFSYISALDADGYHRTAAELANKNNVSTAFSGAWLQRSNTRGYWGLGGTYQLSSQPIIPSAELYKLYYPSGNSLAFLHAFQAHNLGRFHVFSEWAYCPTNGTKAAIAGLLTSLGKHAEVSAVFRNYQPGFVSPFSTAFGNQSQNEKGLYMGGQFHFSRKIWLSIYNDFWKNPWLAYRIYAPSINRDMLWQLDFLPVKKSQLYFRYRVQQKPLNTYENAPMRGYSVCSIRSYRLHMAMPVTPKIEIQMRAETNTAINGTTQYKGNLIFLQIGGRAGKSKTHIVARYSLFQVPWYYARIYAFESQLQNDFGTMAFYGQGNAMYLICTQKIRKALRLGLRLADSRTISPGESQPQRKQSIFVQIIYTP